MAPVQLEGVCPRGPPNNGDALGYELAEDFGGGWMRKSGPAGQLSRADCQPIREFVKRAQYPDSAAPSKNVVKRVVEAQLLVFLGHWKCLLPRGN